MTSSLTYHQKIKDEQHIFIYAVIGRSSSTALQRFINSGNTVWIWGEPRMLINRIVGLIEHFKKMRDDERVKFSLTHMYDSFIENKHLLFYGNGVGNLDSSVALTTSLVSQLLKPWAPKLKRFGFKDIDGMAPEAIDFLRETYPQSFHVFSFRNPLQQWPSVKKVKWPMSEDLQLFLKGYINLSKNYLEYAKKNRLNVFIEDTDLRNEKKVETIMKYLNIPWMDKSLINVTIGSSQGDQLTAEEEEIILNSEAYQNYLAMQKVSRSFYRQQLKKLKTI